MPLVYGNGIVARYTGGTSQLLLDSVTWDTGLGAIDHILGPTDQNLYIDTPATRGIDISTNNTSRIVVSAAGLLTINAIDSYTGTVVLGDGGGSLAHAAGDEGYYNTLVGIGAGASISSGDQNTLVGCAAGTTLTDPTGSTFIGRSSGYANTTGDYNTGSGGFSLASNTTGARNAAVGYNAGRYHADGSTPLATPEDSVYIGYDARGKDDSDSNSIVIGFQAIGLGANTAVIGNTSITNNYFTGKITVNTIQTVYNPSPTYTGTIVYGDGGGSLAHAAGDEGYYNTLVGIDAGASITSGDQNTLVGCAAGTTLTDPTGSTFIGRSSGYANTTGDYNTGCGGFSLASNTTGARNTTIGYNAGRYHSDGSTPLATPEDSIYIGYDARGNDDDDDNSIVIGFQAIGMGADTVVIGNSSVTDNYIYGDFHNRANNGSDLVLQSKTVTLDLSVSHTSANFFADGMLVMGLVARVLTELTGDGAFNASTWMLGDTGDAAHWGDALARAAGTTVDNTDTVGVLPAFYTANSNLEFDETAGTASAGTIRVVCFYYETTAPTS